MTTTAPHKAQETTTAPVLCMAFALREKPWQLGCTPGPGQKPRGRPVAARHQACLLPEVLQATRRCGLPDTAPVVRGDDAGRDGCWRHRFLPAPGLPNQVVDSSAIAVHRRTRRAKRDGWDVRKWLRLLIRYADGERQVWRVGQVPSVEAAAQRHLPRALEPLKQARARTTTRLKGLRSRQGLRLTSLSQCAEPLEALRLWEGSPIPSGLRRRVLRVDAQPQCLRQQLAALEAERRTVRHTSQAANSEQVRQLRHLRGIGINGAGGLVREFFGGRAWPHRRAVGG